MWYFRRRTRKWDRKFSKIIFSSQNFDFKKKVFQKFPENLKFCFWKILDFDIWRLLGHAYGPVCTRRCFLDSFGWFPSAECTRATCGYFFQRVPSWFPLRYQSLCRSSRDPWHLLTWTPTVLRSKIPLFEVFMMYMILFFDYRIQVSHEATGAPLDLIKISNCVSNLEFQTWIRVQILAQPRDSTPQPNTHRSKIEHSSVRSRYHNMIIIIIRLPGLQHEFRGGWLICIHELEISNCSVSLIMESKGKSGGNPLKK